MAPRVPTIGVASIASVWRDMRVNSAKVRITPSHISSICMYLWEMEQVCHVGKCKML